MLFYTVKSLHIIFVVSWFAGLFYLVRLFIYHTEAQDKPETEKQILSKQFEIMEKLLLYAITAPAMVFTWVTGFTMIYLMPELLQEWLYVKIGLVVGLTGYHHYCGYLRKQYLKGIYSFSSKQLRYLNEVATIFLVAVVFLVETQRIQVAFNAVLGFIAFAIAVFGTIKIVKSLKKS